MASVHPTSTLGRAHWLAIGLGAAALAVSFAPNLAFLADKWERDPNYSYGYLVIPITLVVLWTRRGSLRLERVSPPLLGWLPLLAVLLARGALFEMNELYFETLLIPFAAAAAVWAVGGRHLLAWALPPLLFSCFMLTLPNRYNELLADPLQKLATAGSLGTLQILGLPVMADGNVIHVGAESLEVARACNGLSMMLSFATLVAAVVILVEMPLWQRLLLLASAVPIALASNVLRIVGTAMVYHFVGRAAGEKLAHDLAGWLMMPIALALVWIELKVCSWLFVEVEQLDGAQLLRRRGARRGQAPG